MTPLGLVIAGIGVVLVYLGFKNADPSEFFQGAIRGKLVVTPPNAEKLTGGVAANPGGGNGGGGSW